MQKRFKCLWNLEQSLNKEYSSLLDDLKDVLLNILDEFEVENMGVGDFYIYDNVVNFTTWKVLSLEIINKFCEKTDLEFKETDNLENEFNYSFEWDVF